MPKRVLSVGQCSADHAGIKAFLKQSFDAKVQAADTADEAMSMLHNGPFDLVLVNRVLDADGESGLALIKAIKADASTAKIPVMLVSNYSDAQQQAVEHGAEPGFGKSQLHASDVVDRLAPFLMATDE